MHGRVAYAWGSATVQKGSRFSGKKMVFFSIERNLGYASLTCEVQRNCKRNLSYASLTTWRRTSNGPKPTANSKSAHLWDVRHVPHHGRPVGLVKWHREKQRDKSKICFFFTEKWLLFSTRASSKGSEVWTNTITWTQISYPLQNTDLDIKFFHKNKPSS